MKSKILIIEDEPSLLHLMVDKFTQEGFVTFSAINGKKGISIALKKHPDLIILDSIMPIMDGFTTLKILRQDEWGKIAKVVFFTNLNDDFKRKEALDQGVIDYLIKSNVSLKEIVKKVKIILKG